jgi:hypothetical protein
LKRLLRIKNRTVKEYQQISMFNIPDSWQPVVQSVYFGKYVLSSVYTRSGNGDKAVTWSTKIDESGYYDIYCYVGKTGEKMTIRTGDSPQGPPPPPGENSRGNNVYKDMHYKVYHDEGMDEITVDFDNAEAGWNNLGRYYLSPDSAKVELTNQSTGRVVLADAIKWMKVK